MNALKKWYTGWLSGGPHFVVGSKDRPYLYRWYILPRNPWLNLYLHKFLRDDEDRALHDHPWWFVSFMLWGQYWEVTEHNVIHRRWLSVAFRTALHQHRVVLEPGMVLTSPVWTLILTGRKVRNWGFQCGERWVPWEEFCSPNESGQIGRGCD